MVRVEKRQLMEVVDFLREKGLCAYCGEYGSEVEHVVPRVSKLPTYTVLACRECNGTAGDRLFASFPEKQSFILAQYKKRYARVLRLPEWTEDEIDEMGYALRKQIEAYQTVKASIERRLEWSLAHAFYLAEGE